jgi:hypothetical protein
MEMTGCSEKDQLKYLFVSISLIVRFMKQGLHYGFWGSYLTQSGSFFLYPNGFSTLLRSHRSEWRQVVEVISCVLMNRILTRNMPQDEMPPQKISEPP